ncbi:MAG: polyprenyl synthetase family protein [Spirochaetota bacterium]
MIETLGIHRAPILGALERIDATQGESYTGVNAWAPDLRDRLLEFTARGKLIRGSLVAATAEALGRTPDDDVYTVAAAVELVQSFLLVHDDIMDEDPIRRGMPAIYEQYRRYGEERGYTHVRRFGESMGICGGDVAVLMALSSLAGIAADAETRVRLVRLLSDEIAKVGVAQMADVANGHSPTAASEEEIVSVYRFKTGRYTFSLPLMLGAMLAAADRRLIDLLSTWGEIQGVVFQIRDDHLGLMGETGEIGKPSASDVTSNKQTLHRLHLFERLPGSEWADVAGYFGHEHLSAAQISRVREALAGTGTLDLLEARVRELRAEAASLLDQAGLDERRRGVFDAIDEYNASRTV